MNLKSQSEQGSRGLVLHFQVSFMTEWGQSLKVYGEGALLGNWDVKRGHGMACHHIGENELVWEVSVPLPVGGKLSYKYAVVDEGGRVVMDEFEPRLLDITDMSQDGSLIELVDVWQDASHPNLLLSRSAFSEVILANKTRVSSGHVEPIALQPGFTAVRLQLWEWSLQDGDQLVVLGSIPALGNWQPEEALPMTEIRTPHWQAEFRVATSAFPLTYKYAIRSSRGDLDLEVGENRIASISSDSDEKPALIVRCDGAFRQRQLWRGAAVAAPVFSLRSLSSVGVGEFVDIKPLVDFCAATGMRMIQLLPINDTSVYNMWWDSYPYNATSVFALHPLYLCLDALSDDIPKDLTERIAQARKELDLESVDYEATMKAKMSIARELFDRKDHELLQSKEFKAWFAENESWLRPYAIFGFLRDLHGTSEHWRWGTLSHPTPEVLERLSQPDQDHARSLEFVYYVQYQLHRQLLAVSNYAKVHRVALKGDLPIGVSKRSVDTWLAPEQFHMGFSTGAPPDYFDPNGQNWGFPTYNWEEMKKDGYAWWRARLTHMAQYFHAYRIDHILGFFRIWEIPGDCTTGLLGHFRPSIPTTHTSLEAQGIWDLDRLCLPWITPSILEEALGDLAPEAASRYLTEHFPGRYKFREQYDSEEKIQAIKEREGSPKWLGEEVERIKEGLMKLSHNVVLLRDAENPLVYTPRIGLMDTSSFAELNPGWQDHLRWLHDDYYYRRHNTLWSAHALESLPALMRATNMLVCGEDLGMVPDCVHPVLRRLGLLGLRIQRMPGEPGQEFGDPSTYPYLTVATPSCHDTSTTRAWYEEDPDRRDRFFYQALKLRGPVPENANPTVMAAVVKQHLDAPSMWAIFPLQDLLALSPAFGSRPAAEETINDPTNPRHYWRFRIHVRLEHLLADNKFLADLQALFLASGRITEDELPSYHSVGNHT